MIFPLKQKNLPQNIEIYPKTQKYKQKYENIPKSPEIYTKVQKYKKTKKYNQKNENLQLGENSLTTSNRIYN